MAERIEAVFFDLDGTLVRDGARGVVRRTAGALAQRHGLALDDLLAANAVAWKDCWSAHGERWMRGELGDDSLPREIWRLTLKHAGADAPEVVDEALALHLREARGAFTLFAEVAEVLSALRGSGIRLGLITNGPARFQRAKLADAGMQGFFDVIVASGDIGVLKPDGDIFRHALDGLGVDPKRAAHVGDDFVADVVGAVGVGMRAFWINRAAAQAPRPDVHHEDVRSLREVLSAVA